MDEPLPNSSEIPLYFLSKYARRYVKVVLSGEGADELFGGFRAALDHVFGAGACQEVRIRSTGGTELAADAYPPKKQRPGSAQVQ